ncbi:MAG: tetratricopeptide repeat protein [Candidatus Stahlbacteria bacterium]|nr:tetratricopeptide repeat protein [Candidatus Stahlbacteria bacterium]
MPNNPTTPIIVKTHLIPPRLKPYLLRRERLLKRFQDNADKKLILIISGAGYGKTTLLTQFIKDIKSRCVFYSITDSATSLTTFLSYLITAIQSTNNHFGIRTISVMNEITNIRANLEIVMGTFINELVETIDSELFLILDDYHLIDNSELITKSLSYFLEQMPPNIHLIISSRTHPSLSFAKLKAKGELLEITKTDLKFTQDEIQTLLKEIYKLDISLPMLQNVEHHSDGWVTAIQLMSYMIEKSPEKLTTEIEYRLEYFQSEVFAHLSPLVQSFLLNSCILEQMTPNICDTILGKTDSREVLNFLVNKNLFTSCIDEERELFVLHPLFRDFLINKLTGVESKESISAIHLKAAYYFESVNNYSKSIFHYFSANTPDRAIKIIEREGKNLIDTINRDTLTQWLKLVPEDFLQDNPILLWYQGEVYRWQSKWDEAIATYEQAKTKFISCLSTDRERDNKEGLVYTLYGIGTIHIYRGEYTKAIKLGEKAIKLIVGDKKLIKAKLLNLLGVAYFYLTQYQQAISVISRGLKICKKLNFPQQEIQLISNLLAAYGEMGEDDKLIDESERIIKMAKYPTNYPLSQIYSNLGYAYGLKGEYIRAREAFKKAIQIRRTFNDRKGINDTLCNLGFFNLLMGNYELSRSYSRKVIRLNKEMQQEALNLKALYAISRSYLLEGKIISAEKYINKLFSSAKQKTGKQSKSLISCDYLITSGEIKLELGSFIEAEKLINAASNTVGSNKLNLMLVSIALAKLYYKKGDVNLFITHFKKAMEISSAHNYHLPLIRLGRVSRSLLQFAIKLGIEPHYAKFILNQIESDYDLIINLFGGLKIKGRNGKVENPVENPATDGKASGVEDIKWDRAKAKSLFCYLVMNRSRKYTVDQLSELLWPGKSFSKTRNSLYRIIFSIRSYVKSITKKNTPFINYKDECYELNPAFKIWVDIEEFESLLKEASQIETLSLDEFAISIYEIAISLYEGDFLPEVYEIWSDQRRLFYIEQYILALEKVAISYEKRQKYDKVVEYCTRIIAADNFREPAYLLAVQSYIKMGMPGLAISLYKRLEKLLKDELNTEPSEKLKKIIASIKNRK